MSKIEIVTKEKLSKEDGEALLSYLKSVINRKYTMASATIVDVSTVRDCSKEVCEV